MKATMKAAKDLRRGDLIAGAWIIRLRPSQSGRTLFVTVATCSGRCYEFRHAAHAAMAVFTLERADREFWLLARRAGAVPDGPFTEASARRQWSGGIAPRRRRLLYGSTAEKAAPAFPAWALPGDPYWADSAAEAMADWVMRMARGGEWGDLLAGQPELRTFDAIADVHSGGLWGAAGYARPPEDAALAALTEALLTARLHGLPAEALRPVAS